MILVDVGPVALRHPGGWPCRLAVCGQYEARQGFEAMAATHVISIRRAARPFHPPKVAPDRHLVLDFEDTTDVANPEAPSPEHIDAAIELVDTLLPQTGRDCRVRKVAVGARQRDRPGGVRGQRGGDRGADAAAGAGDQDVGLHGAALAMQWRQSNRQTATNSVRTFLVPFVSSEVETRCICAWPRVS